MNRRETLQSLFAASVAGAASPLVAAEGDPMRVAVMGHTGRGNYGHGLDTVWLDYPGVEVVGVSDPVPEGLTKALKRLSIPAPAGFSDYRKMLEATSPDLVAVAPRYVEEHAAMAVAAAEAGAKGIYIEKPFCRDLAEADQIIKACQENGTRLAIAHRNRFHPVLPVVSELIDEGAIGKLLEIRARGKEDARGGCQDLWVLGSHLLNLIHYFAGDPIACSATIYANGKPATATDIIEGPEGVGPIAGNEIRARYEMSSGVPVYFDSLQNAGSKEAGFGFQFIGTNGLIDLRADREPLVHLLEGDPFVPNGKGKHWQPITTAGIGKPEAIEDIRKKVAGHHAAIEDLLSAIREERPTLCSAEDGRIVVAMTMAAFTSHAEGGKRITFPLADKGNPLAKLAPA